MDERHKRIKMMCAAIFIPLCCVAVLVILATSVNSANANGMQGDKVSINESQEPDLEHVEHHRAKRGAPKGPEFRLFTRDNRDEPHLLINKDPTSVDSSSLDPSLPTLVVVHGFWEGAWKPWMHEIKNIRLDMEPSANVILVDWEDLASATFLPYIGPTVNTQRVGDDLADILHFLKVQKGLSISKTHIIGFSLGAHVAGIAGYHLRHSHNSTLARITGLDPAGPIFAEGFITKFYKKLVNVNQRRRLDSSDADFVDVIRTSEGTYGSSIELGHVDFLMNEGSIQPGCRKRDAFKACNHGRAHEYYIESMTSEPSYGFLYKDYWNYKAQSCLSLNKNVFGYNVKKEPVGVFYAKTEGSSPFLGNGSIFVSLRVSGNESLITETGHVKVKIWSDSQWEKMSRCEPTNPESEFTTVAPIPQGENINDSHQIEVCFTKNWEPQMTQVTIEVFGDNRYSMTEEIEATICPQGFMDDLIEILPLWAWILIVLSVVIVIAVPTSIMIYNNC